MFDFRDIRIIYVILMVVLAVFYGYVAWAIFHPDYPSREYYLFYVKRAIYSLPEGHADMTYTIGEDIVEWKHHGKGRHRESKSNAYLVLEQKDIPDGAISLRAWVDPSIHAHANSEGIPADVGLIVNDHELGPYSFIFDKRIGNIEMQFPAELLEHGINEIIVVAPKLKLSDQWRSIKPVITPLQLNNIEDSSRDS